MTNTLLDISRKLDGENLHELVISSYEMAVARLLGRDARRIMSAFTRQVVLDILNEEQSTDGQLRLVGDMLIGAEGSADSILSLLKEFHAGINEA